MEWAPAAPIRTERLELESLSVDHADAMVAVLACEGRWLDAAGIGITRVVASIHPDHVASAAVAAHLGLAPTPELEDGEVRWVRDVPADPGNDS